MKAEQIGSAFASMVLVATFYAVAWYYSFSHGDSIGLLPYIVIATLSTFVAGVIRWMKFT